MYNRRRQQSRFPAAAAAADQGETRRQHDTRARGTYVRTHNNIRRHRHGRHTAYYYHRAVAGRRPLSSHGRGATPRTGRREGAAADRRSPPTAGAAHYRRRDRENDKQHALAPNNVHDNSPPPPRRRRLAHTHAIHYFYGRTFFRSQNASFGRRRKSNNPPRTYGSRVLPRSSRRAGARARLQNNKNKYRR